MGRDAGLALLGPRLLGCQQIDDVHVCLHLMFRLTAGREQKNGVIKPVKILWNIQRSPIAPTHQCRQLRRPSCYDDVMFRQRIGYLWIIGVCLVATLWALFGVYLYVGLIALILILAAMNLIAKRRGWGGYGRLNSRFNRPPFEDESRRSN
jgi:hypothetical protein